MGDDDVQNKFDYRMDGGERDSPMLLQLCVSSSAILGDSQGITGLVQPCWTAVSASATPSASAATPDQSPSNTPPPYLRRRRRCICSCPPARAARLSSTARCITARCPSDSFMADARIIRWLSCRPPALRHRLRPVFPLPSWAKTPPSPCVLPLTRWPVDGKTSCGWQTTR